MGSVKKYKFEKRNLLACIHLFSYSQSDGAATKDKFRIEKWDLIMAVPASFDADMVQIPLKLL